MVACKRILLNIRFPPTSGQAASAQLRTFEREVEWGVDWIETLCDDIDAERLRPRSHVVSRRLVELEGLDDPLSAEIVEAFDAVSPVPNNTMLTKLWEKIDALEPGKQGRFRILVALLQPDAPIDSYHADYLIGWAQDEGISQDAITAAFRATS